MQLTDILTQLAKARQVLAAAEEAVEQAQADLAESPLHKRLLITQAHRDQMRQLVNDTDAEARALTLAAFEATGDKHPSPGANISMYRELDFDAGLLLEWCQAHRPTYVVTKLDATRVRKNAEDLQADGAPVAIVEQPRVKIDTDLSHILPKNPLIEQYEGLLADLADDAEAKRVDENEIREALAAGEAYSQYLSDLDVAAADEAAAGV